MSSLSFRLQASLWGQAYEIFIKRGVLCCLADRDLISLDTPHLQPWRETKNLQVQRALIHELDIIDETVREQITVALGHLATVAYGLGYTAMREYLRHLTQPLENKALAVHTLWCPLTMPGDSKKAYTAERRQICSELHGLLGLSGIIDPALADRGQPAHADFLLWLSGSHKEDHLLVQEYSYDMPGQLGDFRDEGAHLDELQRYRRRMDGRGVFARITAEVQEEMFELSKDIKTHLSAFSTEDKPFYKLCQAAAYAEATLTWLNRHQLLTKPCRVRALAITLNGLESLAARYVPGATQDPRFALMQQMGAAYRQAKTLEKDRTNNDATWLIEEINKVFQQVLSRLPKALRDKFKGLQEIPQSGADYRLDFEDTNFNFLNPAQAYTKTQALDLVENTPDLAEYFGQPAKSAIAAALDELCPGENPPTLRDLHAASIVAGLSVAQKGRLNVLGLEGNPGIGKTTAVIRYLQQQTTGYLFFYVSPRVVINRDVTTKLARRNDALSGILTVTTNAQTIAAAERYHQTLVDKGQDKQRHIEGAVVVDGVSNLIHPRTSVLILSPEQEHDIEQHYAGAQFTKNTLSEYEDLIVDRQRIGVLSAMSTTTRELLELNPNVNCVVLTAALQGFREKSNGRTTLEALSQLFRENREGRAKTEERRRFAARIPTIVMMVDELTGDGAGAPFAHAIADWLQREFLAPFANDSPFTVILVISDASLVNEVVFDRYLNAGANAPDKVLISKSQDNHPFALAVNKVRIGTAKKARVLHIMTNSYPASKLTIAYRINFTKVRIEEKKIGIFETARQAVRRSTHEALLDNALDEIRTSLESGVTQVIYFAQDKSVLGELQQKLCDQAIPGLENDKIAILDSSVPAGRRKKLIAEEMRDSIQVFLMTSSGARGVSFPKTTWIIAAVPRFNIESSLMEIAQLMYRGRGIYHDADGREVSGDNLPRRLVLLIDDFLVPDEEGDPRRWLRQSLDIMTLLIMLRATIFTRITGDAGLRQKLAFVPVGSIGLDELITLMSQSVTRFLQEATVFILREKDLELCGLVALARSSCEELFSRFRVQGNAHQDVDGKSFVKIKEAREFLEQASNPLADLLPIKDDRPILPEHAYCAGAMVLEHWEHFDKRELFSFEGYGTDEERLTSTLYLQLKDIDKNERFPSSLRIPANNLKLLLARNKSKAAQEFSILKDIQSPNIWVALPTTYPQFVRPMQPHDEELKTLEKPEIWHDCLGQTLSMNKNYMPAIPLYKDFPWVMGVGKTNPLQFDLVFDDRYFMMSNELNLLNMLLLV